MRWSGLFKTSNPGNPMSSLQPGKASGGSFTAQGELAMLHFCTLIRICVDLPEVIFPECLFMPICSPGAIGWRYCGNVWYVFNLMHAWFLQHVLHGNRWKSHVLEAPEVSCMPSNVRCLSCPAELLGESFQSKTSHQIPKNTVEIEDCNLWHLFDAFQC